MNQQNSTLVDCHESDEVSVKYAELALAIYFNPHLVDLLYNGGLNVEVFASETQSFRVNLKSPLRTQLKVDNPAAIHHFKITSN